MKWHQSLERTALSRIVRHSKVALVKKEKTLSLGILSRPDLSKIIRYFKTKPVPFSAKCIQSSTLQHSGLIRSSSRVRKKQKAFATALTNRRANLRSKTSQPDTDVIDSETCTNGVLIPSCGSNETIGAPFCRQDLSSPTEEDGKIDYKIKDIECVCCFALCDFESMSQCTDGHLICVDCLNRYTKEAAYGAGKAVLKCTLAGCAAPFPQSELKRCVESSLLRELDDRLQEENINRANLENLARCPKCNFAAELPSTELKFRCLRDTCGQTTCLRCEKLWGQHDHKQCLVAPPVSEEAHRVRIEYEEKMTRTLIRVCSSCKIPFTKSTGCNRMTCRCGMSMCYICRTPDVDFSHFCSHPRCPGESCLKCDNCSLWDDPEEIDNGVIENYRREASKIIQSLQKSEAPVTSS
ncbi:hypothetical protein RRG08_010663 [Elysia crispata]|uniref:RING-type domain-containing protein n=1 Tax=Elysia crispata TaxID=231223 RepID=A0AAE0Z164_9GAST|nr:hypothetical protein RRG08_010663 [Elysia crispata]